MPTRWRLCSGRRCAAIPLFRVKVERHALATATADRRLVAPGPSDRVRVATCRSDRDQRARADRPCRHRPAGSTRRTATTGASTRSTGGPQGRTRPWSRRTSKRTRSARHLNVSLESLMRPAAAGGRAAMTTTDIRAPGGKASTDVPPGCCTSGHVVRSRTATPSTTSAGSAGASSRTPGPGATRRACQTGSRAPPPDSSTDSDPRAGCHLCHRHLCHRHLCRGRSARHSTPDRQPHTDD